VQDVLPPGDEDPASQVVHDNDPAEPEYVPEGQLTHDDPAIGEYVPAGQSKQPDLDSVAPDPIGQSVQLVDPATEVYDPPEQGKHVLEEP
jgi:hypothetical protein